MGLLARVVVLARELTPTVIAMIVVPFFSLVTVGLSAERWTTNKPPRVGPQNISAFLPIAASSHHPYYGACNNTDNIVWPEVHGCAEGDAIKSAGKNVADYQLQRVAYAVMFSIGLQTVKYLWAPLGSLRVQTVGHVVLAAAVALIAFLNYRTIWYWDAFTNACENLSTGSFVQNGWQHAELYKLRIFETGFGAFIAFTILYNSVKKNGHAASVATVLLTFHYLITIVVTEGLLWSDTPKNISSEGLLKMNPLVRRSGAWWVQSTCAPLREASGETIAYWFNVAGAFGVAFALSGVLAVISAASWAATQCGVNRTALFLAVASLSASAWRIQVKAALYVPYLSEATGQLTTLADNGYVLGWCPMLQGWQGYGNGMMALAALVVWTALFEDMKK